MRRLISIDPGARSGIALWTATKPVSVVAAGSYGGVWLASWRAIALPPARRERYLTICTDALVELDAAPDTIVIIEGQWAITPGTRAGRRAGAAHGRDVAALVERRCAWQYAAEQLTGWSTDVIQPATWMPIAKDCPGATPGARVQWLVEHALGVHTGLDEAAAIGLGLWWLRQ